MTEAVQFHLERQLPELRDLVEKEIFSEKEVKDIVRKRTKFEYKLQRRISQKEDFLAYIAYEKDIESTRKARVLESGIKRRHATSDHSIVQHIYSIFKRAVTKFKGDIELWQQYIDYALETDGKSVLDRVFATALSQNPLEPTFWIKSAKWEFEGKGSSKACRSLLQKGVRLNPRSSALWQSYFEFELSFASKLAVRRQLLGISQPQDFALEELALTVQRHSFNSRPSDYALHQNMFNLALNYPMFPNLIEKMLINFFNAFKDCQDFPHHLSYVLENKLLSSVNMEMLLSSFSGITSVLPKNEQILSSLSLFEKLLQSSDSSNVAVLFDKIDQIFQTAQDEGILDEEMYLKWIRISESHGVLARDILQNALFRYPESSVLAYYAAWGCVSQNDFGKALLHLKSFDSVDRQFWDHFFQSLSRDPAEFLNVLGNAFEFISHKVLEALPLQQYILAAGILPSSQFETMCENFLQTHLRAHFVFPLIILNHVAMPSPDVNKVIALYEKVIRANPTKQQYWMDYIKFTLDFADITQASSVLLRALTQVEDPERLSLDYENLLQGLDLQ